VGDARFPVKVEFPSLLSLRAGHKRGKFPSRVLAKETRRGRARSARGVALVRARGPTGQRSASLVASLVVVMSGDLQIDFGKFSNIDGPDAAVKQAAIFVVMQTSIAVGWIFTGESTPGNLSRLTLIVSALYNL